MTEANSILDGINGTVAHRSQHPPAAYPAFRGIGVSCSVNTEIYGLNKRAHTHTLTHTHTLAPRQVSATEKSEKQKMYPNYKINRCKLFATKLEIIQN